MGKISRYSFSLILFLYSGVVFSQAERTVGLRLGFDISKLSLNFIQPERKTFEGSMDMELFKNVYPAIEFGSNSIKLHKDTLFNYYSNGYYGRIGVDYNLIKPLDSADNEMLIAGIRYGYAFFNDHADSIRIKDNYWGDFHGNLPAKSLKAQWIELVFGLRTEVFKNFYLGFSIRSRMRLAKIKEDQAEPYWIPGYGKGNAKACFGFNYSIYYSLPLYKKQFKIKEVTKDK